MTRSRFHATRVLWAVWACLLVISSCSYVSFPDGEEQEGEESILVSIEAGEILLSGELIEISVNLDSDRPSESRGSDGEASADVPVLTIELYSVPSEIEGDEGASGDPPVEGDGAEPTEVEPATETTPLFELELPISAEEPIPPLSLDDLGLPSGEYILVFRLNHPDGRESAREITFYYAGNEYAIVGVYSDSPIILPESTVMLWAEIAAPDDSDPFIRWMADEGVLSQGYLSEGASELLWAAGADEGIYTVRVDLFPVLPEAQEAEAPMSMAAELYVFRSDDEFLGDLDPHESYFALFHLSGDLDDQGVQSEEEQLSAEFTDSDGLRLVTRGRVVGYELDGKGGIRIPRLLIPTDDESTQPFTLTIGFTALDTVGSTKLFDTRGDSGAFLTIGFDAESMLVADIGNAETSVRVNSNLDFSAERTRRVVSFSVIPDESEDEDTPDGFRAVWFVEGEESSDTRVPLRLTQSSSEGETVIGGSSSPRGIIDEVGVYFRDPEGNPSPNPDIYQSWRRQTDPGSHIFADGFDGMYLSELYVTTGSVEVVDGVLRISANSGVTLPIVTISEKPVESRIDIAAPLALTARVVWYLNDSAEPLFTFDAESPLAADLWPESSLAVLTARSETGLSAVLIVDGEEVLQTVVETAAAEPDATGESTEEDETQLEDRDDEESADSLRVEISNGTTPEDETEADVQIDSVTVLRRQ